MKHRQHSHPIVHRLLRLRAEWRIASPNGRAAIAEQIADHPEWGLQIKNGQIEEIEF